MQISFSPFTPNCPVYRHLSARLPTGRAQAEAGLTPHCLAFDPGRDKTGFALINIEGGLIFSGMFASSEREKFFEILLNGKNLDDFIIENPVNFSNFSDLIKQIKFTAIGNGTRSKEFYEFAKKILPLKIKIVDERNTTLEARNLYWKLHKPGFFKRILPKGLRVPPRVLDDLAAWAIAIRAVRS